MISAATGRCRRPLRAEDGSVIIVALSILLITSILTAGLLTLVMNDAGLSATDLEGKRAYAAAQSGVQYFLGQLNANATSSNWWQTCSNDTTNGSTMAVPGTAGETYSYQPVVSGCTGTNAVGTVLDPSTGLLRMKFSGYDGTHGQSRTIIADFRPVTPLSYLWFTVSETVDPNSVSGAANGCNGATYSSGNAPTNSGCWLLWASNDRINGPMYTQDQYYVSSTGSTGPTFGRNAQDTIAASGSSSSVCVTGNGLTVPTTHACPAGVTMNGTPKPGAPIIPLPDQNQALATDASSHGLLLNPGTTTLTLAVNASGQTVIQSGETCTTTSSSSCVTTSANGTALAGANLSNLPVVYAPNPTASNCPTYDPTDVTYPTVSSGTYSGSFTGACGDLYVSGTYNTSLTLGAADSVIVTGNLLNQNDTNPTGSNVTLAGAATLGLVANQYVRVYRPVSNPASSYCAGTSSTPGNITIDGAVLALSHSFDVDNYDCGSPATLTIHGALAQKYRGPVATVNSNGAVTGYNKSYNYDNRFKYVMPPYVFDLQNTSWTCVRETEANGS
jgi:hypothetical protein